jgi:hypothetical protein
MKKLFFSFLMLSGLAVSAADIKKGETEITRTLLKQELESHLSFPSEKSQTDFDVVFIELVVKGDGHLEVLNMNAASAEVRRSIEEQIRNIKIVGPVMEETSFAFRVHFRRT